MKLARSIAIIALLVSTAAVTACGGNTEAPSSSPSAGKDELLNSGMPIVKSPITLKVFSGKPPQVSSDWNGLMLWKEYEKMTGIHIDWSLVPSENLDERRNIILAGGDYPDIFYASTIPYGDLVKYGEAGVFVPLNELIEKHALNFKKLMDRYPDIKKAITSEDGNIYSLPGIFDPEFISVRSGQKLWFKQEWLDQLGLKTPESLEELYQYLKKVKETDLNKNGKQDEIPIMFRGVSHIIPQLLGAWGLGNRGNLHPYVDVDPKTNELRFIPADPGYKEMLQFINRLYKEGIFDKDMFTMTNEQFVVKAGEGNVGSFLGIGAAAFNGTGYTGSGALKGPTGIKMYNSVLPSVILPGAFAVTSKNKYPEASLRWIDYFYGDEGNLMYFMGFEGVTYKKGASGEYEFTDEIVNNPKGLNLNQAIGQYLVWPGTNYPGIVMQKTFKGTEGRPEVLEAAEKFRPDLIKEAWPGFNFTKDELEQLNVSVDIGTYVAEMTTKFASGEASFDAWDNYVDTIRKMGLDKYMKAYKSAYERYNKVK